MVQKKPIIFCSFVSFGSCRIPECELSNSSAYEPSWLLFAVPYNDAKPSKCDRYVHRQVNNETMNNTCTKFDFDHSRIDRCHDFVYAENDSSILTEVHINMAWRLHHTVRKFKCLTDSIVFVSISFSSDYNVRRIETNWQWLARQILLDDYYSHRLWDIYRIDMADELYWLLAY